MSVVRSTCQRNLSRATARASWVQSQRRSLHATSVVAARKIVAELPEKNLIGNPDPLSNIRPVRYYIPPNESAEDKEWRQWNERVNKLHQDFWSNNNYKFLKEKEEYIAKIKKEKGTVSAEDLSMFYKSFLNEAYGRHLDYNKTWIKENFRMLLPGLKALLRGKSSQVIPYFKKSYA
ncbi:hypothetical protein K493DRAFT_338958 [Basidiobolus meristosporus CBS 931.73]|uniref:Apoptogenic protein 1, mitochondrial n=1 Tax=Basidiobolus meristosporus CBS 931.73 TaxID=1314790 RepID=A0A1Y1Y2G1_9FUNG|nr:hypothetical protein K493DRAFT_338958 [Basidiobolus meristosporus CBS 931.73]|eukprot:ORX92159.1 hypothetical protein K493DRAFT_338958 [Basidiobolus meristosporus CBS 931.73]